jgi:hypothetical protein
LRLHDQNRCAQLVRRVPPVGDLGEARRLLRRVVATVDASRAAPAGAARSTLLAAAVLVGFVVGAALVTLARASRSGGRSGQL